ncbi:MAG TPA: hypothetical protein VHF67_02035 [Gaiellaceae bacterium]|nr:hypothetical protein [Gaiellaceae bacterium]
MEAEPVQRARIRLGEDGPAPADRVALDAALERAREALEALADRTAELEAAVPERLGAAVRESMRVEVVPVGRHVAEVRGLANQTIRRLERLQLDVNAERRARVDDLAVLVDLVAAGWRGVDGRLDRLERALDRLKRSLEERPIAELYRLEERHGRSA